MAGALFLAPTVLSDCYGPASSNTIPSSTLVTSYITPSGVSRESSYTSGATLVVESMSMVTVYASSQLSGYKKRGASPSHALRQDTATTLIKTMTVVPLPLSRSGLYTATSGDYLYAIATANNVPLDSLTALNPTINPTLITPGQVINIRATSSFDSSHSSHTTSSIEHLASNVQRQTSCPAALATQPCPSTYIVASGDTFYSIATCCGTTYGALGPMNTYLSSALPVGATVTISGANWATVSPYAGPNPSPVPAGNGLYTVAATDDISGIASANSIPLASLSALNPNMNLFITPGQVLTVRTPGPRQTTPPAPPQRRESPADNGVYTIQPSDNLHAIASAYGIPLSSLVAMNPTSSSQSSITVSQIINVPLSSPISPISTTPATSQPSSTPGNNGAYSTYIVVSRDNFYGIAATNSIPVSSLMAANPVVTNPALISVSQLINLPSPGLGARAHEENSAVVEARDNECRAQTSSTSALAPQPIIQSNPTSAPPSQASRSSNEEFTVYVGEDLVQVASQYNIPLASLTAGNPSIAPTASLSLGQVVWILTMGASSAVSVIPTSSQASNPMVTPPPAPSGSSPSMTMPCNPPSYTVMLGDTLYAIAQACGISLDALTSANNGIAATALQVGATLSIPSGGNVQAQTAAVAPFSSVGPSPTPGSSPLSSNSPAASTPAVSGNPYPNAVTPPAGYPSGDFYTTGGNKVSSAQSSSQLGSSSCADNTALNCIVIGPGTTHTHVPSSSATPLLSEVPCGPGGGMTCIVFNGQTLTLSMTSNTLESTTSSSTTFSASSSWISSPTTSNGITSSSSATTLLTQASSTISRIATFSRSSSANNLKIPMWLLVLYFIGVTMALSSSSQMASSLTVSSTSSSVVVSSIPTTLMTSTTSQPTALNSVATSTNNSWMWSILYELARVSQTTKSRSTLVPTTQSSSSTGQVSVSANQTVSSSSSTSKLQNSTIAPSITKRSAGELQTSLVTLWSSPTPCPDNTLALCEVIPARTFTRVRGTGNYSTHTYPRPTASPCPDQLSMGCIRMEHNTLSFVWSHSAAISGSGAKAQSTISSSSASMTKRSVHELVTSTITSIPSPTLCTDNKSYYCYTFGTRTVSSLTSLFNDTAFSYPLPTASPCPDESSKGCLSLEHKTLSFLWLNNATSLASGPSFAASAIKRQPPLTFSASAFPQPKPCPDNPLWECVDFGTSTYSFNPSSVAQGSLSTSEVATLSSTNTLTSTTTVPASKNESISAPLSTKKTSAASKSLKLPSWILFLCSIRGAFAMPGSDLAGMVSSTSSPKVIRLEPLTTVTFLPAATASRSAAIKSTSLPSWLLLFFTACAFAFSKPSLSSMTSVPTLAAFPIEPKSIPLSLLTSGSASINSLPRLSTWLALPFFSFACFVLTSALEGPSNIDFEHAIPGADDIATGGSSFPIWSPPLSLIGATLALGSRLGTRSLITPGILFMILHTLAKPTFAQLTSSPSAMTNVETSLIMGGYQYQGQGSWTGFVGVSTPGVEVVSLGGRRESADRSSVGYSITRISVSSVQSAKSTISPRNMMKEVVTMTHVSVDVSTASPTTVNIVLTLTSSRLGTYSPESLPTTYVQYPLSFGTYSSYCKMFLEEQINGLTSSKDESQLQKPALT